MAIRLQRLHHSFSPEHHTPNGMQLSSTFNFSYLLISSDQERFKENAYMRVF